MPKINVYLPDPLAEAVRDAKVPVSAICQAALEQAVRGVASAQATDEAPDAARAVGLFARFTPRARQATANAESEAQAVPHDFVGTEHLLLGVIAEGGNLALKVLEALQIEPADLRAEVEASMLAPSAHASGGNPPFTPLAKQALAQASTEALSLAHNYIGCEHLLLGLLATEDGLASRVMRRMGLELRITRRAVIAALAGVVHARPTDAPPARPGDDRLDEVLRRLDAIEARLPG